MTARVGMWRDVARQAESVRRSRRSPETERVLVRATAAGPRASAPSSLSALDNATMRTPALKPCTQAAEPRSGVRQHERQWRCDLRVVQRFARSSLPASLAFTPNTTGHAEPPNTARVAVSWKCDSRREMAAAPSRRSFVVRWKASRCFDDELGIIPSHSADAPALGVLELDQRRRDAHRRDADDDMEAPSELTIVPISNTVANTRPTRAQVRNRPLHLLDRSLVLRLGGLTLSVSSSPSRETGRFYPRTDSGRGSRTRTEGSHRHRPSHRLRLRGDGWLRCRQRPDRRAQGVQLHALRLPGIVPRHPRHHRRGPHPKEEGRLCGRRRCVDARSSLLSPSSGPPSSFSGLLPEGSPSTAARTGKARWLPSS